MGRPRLRPLSKNKAIYKSFVTDILGDINKIEKETLKEASNHVKNKIKEKVKIKFKKKTGNLLKGIKYEFQDKDRTFVGVGPPAYHAHLLELGTIHRETKKGYSKGKIIRDPFIRPTFEEESEEVKRIMRGQFSKL